MPNPVRQVELCTIMGVQCVASLCDTMLRVETLQ